MILKEKCSLLQRRKHGLFCHPSFFIGEKEIDGTKLMGNIENEGKQVTYSLGYPESELILSLLFEKTDDVWMLIKYIAF